MEDQALLKRFNQTGSEEAFRTLVAKHLGMVMGVAERRTGKRTAAEEIAQDVFNVLARKARELTKHPTLTGWLYRTTLNECAIAHRRDQTHARKMKELSDRLQSDSHGTSVWQDTMPLLDEAIDKLPDADRDLILRRFFDRQSFRQIGDALGKSEAAAQKQGERALRRLSDSLRTKGVAITATILAAQLTAQAVPKVSDQLINTISSASVLGASEAAGTLTLFQSLVMNSTSLKTAAVVAACAAVPIVAQWNTNQKLLVENDALRAKRVPTKVITVTKSAPLAQTDPIAPANELTPAPSSSSKPRSASQLADSWELALYEADPVKRTQRIASLLAQLTPENAPRAAAVFQQARKQGRNFGSEYRLFLRAWGRIDGEAAVNHLVPSGEVKQRSSDLLAAIAGWSSAHPMAARDWIELQPNEKYREELIYGLLDGWSMSNFSAAAAYAESRPRSTSRNRFRKLLLDRAIASGGIPAAQQWFHAIPEDEHNSLYKQYAFNEVIEAMLYRDPAAAAHWLSQQGGQKHLTSKPIMKTASMLAQGSPEKAMQWLNDMNHVDNKGAANGRAVVLREWAVKDASAAGNWLQTQNDSTEYNVLAGSYAQAIARQDPERAIDWAKSINDEKLRTRAEKNVAAIVARGKDGAQLLAGAGYTGAYIQQAQSRSALGGTLQGLAFSGGGSAGGGAVSYTYAVPNNGNAIWNLDGEKLNIANKPVHPHGNKYQSHQCAECHVGSKYRALADLEMVQAEQMQRQVIELVEQADANGGEPTRLLIRSTPEQFRSIRVEAAAPNP